MKTPLFFDKKGEFFKKRKNMAQGVYRALFEGSELQKKRKINDFWQDSC